MTRTRKIPFGLLGIVVVLGCLPWRIASAYFEFVPTPTEWSAWPEYCRVQYVFIMQERSAEYGNAYGQADFDRLKGQMGSQAFLGLHHYCAGLHWYNRARAQTNKGQRDFMMNTALEETLYTYKRAEHTSFAYPDMAVHLAKIKRAMGHPEESVEILKQALQEQPERLSLYGALAMVYREQKQLPQARDVLLDADKMTDGKSAEVQYNLGLINLEMGDVDAAVANAGRAYAQDYPLPGLRDKLKKIGRWPPPAAEQPTASR